MSWNVNGLKNKTTDIDFMQFCNTFDIIGTTETWSIDENDFSHMFVDYDVFACNGEKPKRGRIAGGVAIFLKHDLIGGVKLLNTKQSDSVFLLLDKQFFGFTNDIVFGVVYLPPIDSKRHERKSDLNFDSLEDVLLDLRTSYSTANFLISGDFNARSGTEHDFILDDSYDYIPSIDHVDVYNVDSFCAH